jgi:GNAT superfamily N-acetyltransferase
MQFTITQHRATDELPPDMIKSMEEWVYIYGRPEYWFIAKAMLIADWNHETWVWAAYSGLKILSKEQIHSPYDIMPGAKLGYCGPVYVKPEFRGSGLQRRLLAFKERVALEMGVNVLTAAVDYDNIHSANNIIKCGFLLAQPPAAIKNCLYFVKHI